MIGEGVVEEEGPFWEAGALTRPGFGTREAKGAVLERAGLKGEDVEKAIELLERVGGLAGKTERTEMSKTSKEEASSSLTSSRSPKCAVSVALRAAGVDGEAPSAFVKLCLKKKKKIENPKEELSLWLGRVAALGAAGTGRSAQLVEEVKGRGLRSGCEKGVVIRVNGRMITSRKGSGCGEASEREFVEFGKALEAACCPNDETLTKMQNFCSELFKLNPSSAPKQIQKMCRSLDAAGGLDIAERGGLELSEGGRRVSDHLRSLVNIHWSAPRRELRQAKEEANSMRNEALHPTTSIACSLASATEVARLARLALAGRWIEGEGERMCHRVEAAAMFGLCSLQITPRNLMCGEIKVGHVREAMDLNCLGSGTDGGCVVTKGLVVRSSITKSGNKKTRAESCLALPCSETLVIMSGVELAFCTCLLILKSRAGGQQAFDESERLFSFAREESPRASKFKGTTRLLKSHAWRYGREVGLSMFPDTTGMRASCESAIHEMTGDVAFGFLIDTKLSAPKMFSQQLASILGHTLEVSKRHYVSAKGMRRTEAEKEREKNHCLFNAIYKMSFYPRCLGGLNGHWPWKGMEGKERAQTIVDCFYS